MDTSNGKIYPDLKSALEDGAKRENLVPVDHDESAKVIPPKPKARKCPMVNSKLAPEHTGPYMPLMRNKKIEDYQCSCGKWMSDLEGVFLPVAAYVERERAKESIRKAKRRKYERLQQLAEKEARKKRPRAKPMTEGEKARIEQARRDRARSKKMKPWRVQKNRKKPGGKTLQQKIAKQRLRQYS